MASKIGGMGNADGALVFGIVIIVLGTVPGLWHDLTACMGAGIVNFSAALRGIPPHASAPRRDVRRSEPLVALLGLAVVLLGILSQLTA